MTLSWFKTRNYQHLDNPVGVSFAEQVTTSRFASRHSFSPFIRFWKTTKRYKKVPETNDRRISCKKRPIMYASHRDSCVFRYFAYRWNQKLESYYQQSHFNSCVIGYRKLGKANYDFAAEAYDFAAETRGSIILTFDFSDFFGSLDHAHLKQKLKQVLGCASLSDDDYAVFKNITKYHYIDRDCLEPEDSAGDSQAGKKRPPYPRVGQLKARGIEIKTNPGKHGNPAIGIVQGAPISAVLSNIYMIDFDRDMKAFCDRIGGFYRRYSDDILIICHGSREREVHNYLQSLVVREKLELQDEKFERYDFQGSPRDGAEKGINYLGIHIRNGSVGLREATLARQHRKMRWAIRREKLRAYERAERGESTQIYTNKLRKRFSYLTKKIEGGYRTQRNFSSYARHCAEVFKHREHITTQIRSFEKTADREIRNLKEASKV